MKVLLTAFEPFDNRPTNASLDVVREFRSNVESFEIVKEVLPVIYDKFAFIKIFEKHKDVDLFLLTGEAGGRLKVSLEEVALNVMSAVTPDNEGILKSGETIIQGGKNAYFCNLDLKAIESQLNIEYVQRSYHAGTYICNLLYYLANDYIVQHSLKTACLFVHFPYIEDSLFSIDDGMNILNDLLHQIEKQLRS